MIAEATLHELAELGGLNEEQRFVLKVIRRLDHPVLNHIFFERLRGYQLAWLLDFSMRRIGLKGRRLGFTEVDALDTVLTSSGWWAAIGSVVNLARDAAGLPHIAFPVAHNTNVISHREKEAKDYIERCKKFCEVLSVDCSAQIGEERDVDFRAYFVLERDNDTFLKFKRSQWQVVSDTQSENAGRGDSGHLKKDEAAHYKHAKAIVKGADQIPLSSDVLRLSEFSTPNGTEGPGEVFHLKWTDTRQYGDYSRHEVSIFRAVSHGFPTSPEKARASCLTDEDFEEEYNCKFIGTRNTYFTREMLAQAEVPQPQTPYHRRVVGIDVASELDLTALVVLDEWPEGVWFTGVYLIRGVPYSTDDIRQTGSRELGQDFIVSGLLWALNPDAAIMDISADGSILYGLVTPHTRQTCRIKGHSFHSNGRAWKAEWIPLVRHGFESGKLNIAAGLQPLIYQRGNAELVTPDTAQDFIRGSFRAHLFDALQHDYRRIERKQLEQGITFSSPRDSRGHGDSAWAGTMGFSLIGHSRASDTVRDEVKSLLNAAAPSPMEYEGYL